MIYTPRSNNKALHLQFVSMCREKYGWVDLSKQAWGDHFLHLVLNTWGMVVKEMVGNDCGSVKITFMATFFYFSIIRQTRKKNSATLLSEIIFSECLQSRPLLGWYSAEWAGFVSLGLFCILPLRVIFFSFSSLPTPSVWRRPASASRTCLKRCPSWSKTPTWSACWCGSWRTNPRSATSTSCSTSPAGQTSAHAALAFVQTYSTHS